MFYSEMFRLLYGIARKLRLDYFRDMLTRTYPVCKNYTLTACMYPVQVMIL
jgi:hypothetical protein